MDSDSTFLMVMGVIILIAAAPFILCWLFAVLAVTISEPPPADKRTPEEKRLNGAGGWLNMHK